MDRARVIAADSGLEHALALGLDVDLVVGDMDSVSPAALAAAEVAGSTVEQHPVAKDETDLELALNRALDLLPAAPGGTGRTGHPSDGAKSRGRVVVIGGVGGRLDHLLSVALLLAAPAYAEVSVEARLGPAALHVVRDVVTLHGRPGELVTLLPLHGPARGVTTEGLLYPLEDEDLGPGTSRGVSNVFRGETASVRLREGILLAIQPHALDG